MSKIIKGSVNIGTDMQGALKYAIEVLDEQKKVAQVGYDYASVMHQRESITKEHCNNIQAIERVRIQNLESAIDFIKSLIS